MTHLKKIKNETDILKDDRLTFALLKRARWKLLIILLLPSTKIIDL